MISHKGKPLIGQGPEALTLRKNDVIGLMRASNPFIKYNTTM